MTERLQNILNEINNETRTNILDLNLSKEELLAKDKYGVSFIEYLLTKKIPLFCVKDKIKNNTEIAYLLFKYNDLMLYSYKIDEKMLFSYVNGKRLIDYIIEKNKIRSDIIKIITDNVEIIDLLCQDNNRYYLSYLSPEIINKLITKDNNGSYLIEKYLNDDGALKYMIPLINDRSKLLEICSKYDNYSFMQYANANILMNKYNQDSTILEFLINEKNIVPDVLNNIPNNIDFVNFLIKNKYYDYLKKADEYILLIKVSPSKTLLEELIDKGYNPNTNIILKTETLNILYKCNKLNLIENSRINSTILLESALNVFQNETNKDETILEYLINNNYNIKKSISYSNDKDIIKILYKKGKPDLLALTSTEKLLVPIEENSPYTYFDYILDNIKEDKVKVSIDRMSHIYDIDVMVKFYIILAKHDMMEYVEDPSKDKLLEKENNRTLLECLLDADSKLTLEKIISRKNKADPEIAFIIKSKGLEQKDVNISKDNDNYVKDYLDGVNNHLGIGPLHEEGEKLLGELQNIFNDGRSDESLISALISGYRQALFSNDNYEAVLAEIRKLIEIKKQNMNRFFYIKKKDSGYFSQGNGSVFCGNTQVEPLLHETGHALHYYTVQCKTPDDYNEIVAKARQNPELLVKAEKLSNEYHEIRSKIETIVEHKYNNFFDGYYNEERRQKIRDLLAKSKEEKKIEYESLNIPEDQLDIILNEMYTEEEYISHQKRIYIRENVEAILRNEISGIFATSDIIDAILEGKFHSGALKNSQGEKIKQMPGHGLYYYFETDFGFNEMIANFASMSKSKEAGKNLLMLKDIVGEEVYNMISNFYYKEIIQLNTEDLEVSKGKRGK